MIEVKYGTRKVINFRGAKKVVGGLTDQNKINILLYISKELANVETESDLFIKVISLCKEIFEVDNTTLHIFDNEENLVPVIFLKETDPPKRNLKSGEGYSGACFQSKQSLLIPDLENYPGYLDEKETTRSVMVVPILYKDDALGTLSIESDTEFFYEDGDLEILEALGSQLALSLTSVRLFEGVMTARKREQEILGQLEFDMKLGRKVQSQIIPQNLKPWNGINFGMYYEPMTEVSGDYLDVVRQSHSVTAIIADVSGHGIPAALVTMAIHHQFRKCVFAGLGLTEIMEELGESLRPQLPESTYFTAALIRVFSRAVDSDNLTFAYCNAGHPKILHYINEVNLIEELDTKGIPLGIMKVRKLDFEEKREKLADGDMLILYSDGFTEQKNTHRKEIGLPLFKSWLMDGKEDILKSSKEAEVLRAKKEDQRREHPSSLRAKNIPKILTNKILENYQTFKGEEKNGDDLSLLLIGQPHEFSKANSLFRKALKADNLKIDLDSYKYALEAYMLEPSLKDNLLFLGKINYRDGKYAASIQYLEEYIDTSGDDSPLAYFLLARSLYKVDEFSACKKALKKSLSSDPAHVKSCLLLAKCYLAENEKHKAIRTLELGVKHTQGNDFLKQSLKLVENSLKKQLVTN